MENKFREQRRDIQQLKSTIDLVGLIRTLAEEYRYMGGQEETGMDYWMFSLP